VPYPAITRRLCELALAGVDIDALPGYLTVGDLFRQVEFFHAWRMPPDVGGLAADTMLCEIEL
jgi:hypothetical protein